MELVREHVVRGGRWILGEADWPFQILVSVDFSVLIMGLVLGIDSLCNAVTNSVIVAAELTIPKSKPKKLNRVVPWWSKERSEAIRIGNKVFRVLKKTLRLY